MIRNFILSTFMLKDHQLIRWAKLGAWILLLLTVIMIGLSLWAASIRNQWLADAAEHSSRSPTPMPETNDPEKLRAMLKIERSYATTLKQIQLDTSISILGSGIVLCLTVAVLLANIAMAYTRARELALEVQSLKERQRTSAPRDRSEDPRRASRLAPLSHQ